MNIYDKYSASFRFSTFWTLFFIGVLSILISNNTNVLHAYTSSERISKQYNFFNPWSIWWFIIDQKRFEEKSFVNNIELSDNKTKEKRYQLVVDLSNSVLNKKRIPNNSNKLLKKIIKKEYKFNIGDQNNLNYSQLVSICIGNLLEKNGVLSQHIYPSYYVDNTNEKLCNFNGEGDIWYKKIINDTRLITDNMAKSDFHMVMKEILDVVQSDSIEEVILLSDFKHYTDKTIKTLVNDLLSLRSTYKFKPQFKLIKILDSLENDKRIKDYSEVVDQVFTTDVHSMTHVEMEQFIQSDKLQRWLNGFSKEEVNDIYASHYIQMDGHKSYDLVCNASILYNKGHCAVHFLPDENADIYLVKDNLDQRLENTENEIRLLEIGELHTIKVRDLNETNNIIYCEISDHERHLKEKFRIISSPHLTKNVIDLWIICLLAIFSSISIPISIFFKEVFFNEKKGIYYFCTLIAFNLCFCWPWFCSFEFLHFASFSLILVFLVGLFMFSSDNEKNVNEG